MGAQKDLIPGLDISALASVTKTQLMAMVSGAAPYPNIGLVFYGPTTPDIANNARFKRYLWIDTSTVPFSVKYYNTTTSLWAETSAGTISLATQIADGIITLAKLSISGGGALKLVRINGANTGFEFINFSDLLSAGAVPFTAIETTGAMPNYFLKQNNAGNALVYEAFAASFIPADSISPSQLQNGSAGNQILVSNGAGNAYQETDLPTILASLFNDTLNGAATEYYPATLLSNATKYIQTAALAGRPRIIKASFVCTSAELDYAVGDEVDYPAMLSYENVSGDHFPMATLIWDSSTSKIKLWWSVGADGPILQKKSTAAYALAAVGKWAPKLTYWL